MLRVEVQNRPKPGEAWHYVHTLSVELVLSYPASCRVIDRGRASSAEWDLDSHIEDGTGPFGGALSWVTEELWSPDLVEADPALQLGDELHGGRPPGSHHAYASMEELCLLAARRAVACCQPVARMAAMQLPVGARFFAYAALLADPTGRVREMIDVCPNLFVLGACCAPDSTQAYTLIDGIQRGSKLSGLVDLVLEWACESFNSIGVRLERCRSPGLLVRRAPAMSPGDLLHLLHAPGLDINDLAGAGASAGSWIQTMVAWAGAARRIANLDRARTLGGFWSKHAVEINGREKSHIEIQELMDWLLGTGAAPPGRNTSPARVRHEIDEWHANVHREVHYPPETRLARGPVVSRSIHGIDQIVALESVGELVAEGHEMAHCVASLASEAIVGDVFLYRAVVANARVTLAIVGAAGRWSLREASGVANRRLSADEMAAIYRWLEVLPERSRVSAP